MKPSRLDLQQVRQILESAPRLTIALVGDLFLDRYLHIDPERQEVSLETGLPAHQVVNVRNQPGALGTVMNNLAALGAGRLYPVTAIGEDGLGWDLLQALRQLPVDPRGIIQCPGRLTPTYIKPLVPEGQGWRELNRLDVRTRENLPVSVVRQLVATLEGLAGQWDALVVLDQFSAPEVGVVVEEVRAWLERWCSPENNRLVLVDSRTRIGKFCHGMLKGTLRELASAAGMAPQVERSGEIAGWHARRTGQVCFCTLGEHGIAVAWPDGSWHRVPAVPVEGPIDPVGAGDSVTAALAVALAAGADPLQAAALACLVASVTITKLGTTGTATPEEVEAAWARAIQRGWPAP